MSKFRVRWTNTVTEYWYTDIDAKDAKEAEEIYFSGEYDNSVNVLDEKIIDFTDFDSVEKLKINKKGKKNG